MNKVTVTDATLRIEPAGLDKLWSLRRRLDIPLAHVRGATLDPGVHKEPKGIRKPGLAVPGKWAGTFSKDGEKSFWNVGKTGETIVIELCDEQYERLVLSVEDP